MGVRVGTSGWSYEDWEGPVYPPDVKPTDRLAHYAGLLPTVEVNVTFYRTPSPAVVKGWIDKVRDAPGFDFTLKAPRDLTQHALAEDSPRACARLAREWADEVARPLADARRLGALFLQLSPGVLHHEESMARLDATLDALAGHGAEADVAVEFRNRTWLDERLDLQPDAVALMDRHQAAIVTVDGPSFPALIQGTAPHAYLRFHGRNEDVWLKGGRNKPENNDEDPRMNRYDYFYDEAELRPWAKRAQRLAEEKRVVRTYFNNHPGGQALHDAKILQGLLHAAGAPVEGFAGVAGGRPPPRQARL